MENVTVEKAWELYQMAVLSSSKRRSQVSEGGRWKHHISPALGEKTIDKLTGFDLLILRRTLEDRGLSPQSVRHCLSLLGRVLRKAAEWEQYDKPLPNFKSAMPKFDNMRQRFLSREEYVALLDALKEAETSWNWHDITIFAVSTGLRRGEIFNLRLSDVNFHARMAAVMDTKSGKNRTVKLNDDAFAVALKKKRPLTDTNTCSRKQRQKCSAKRSKLPA